MTTASASPAPDRPATVRMEVLEEYGIVATSAIGGYAWTAVTPKPVRAKVGNVAIGLTIAETWLTAVAVQAAPVTSTGSA